ncbi:MAG: YhfC family intramembrane metalloprotease [Lachnospiraceae bacterium]|nr:YhfC family intramembrane metalloprotease [Lachnospiraceae bacterium]
MYDFPKIGTDVIAMMVAAMVIFVVAPIVLWIVWCVKKKEKFTTILVGAAAFFLFAIVLEKPIQNVLIFPTAMGLKEHAASQFINARPVLWAFLVGFFPGLFEETGRFVAFKTILKKRKNRETSISYGLGHGGFEVLFILSLNYLNYIIYAIMINSGTFGTIIEQLEAVAPDQVGAYLELPAQMAAYSAFTIFLTIWERIFAVLFHTGASIMVFYACKDKKKFWLYPLAILVHTAMDGMLGLVMANVIYLSDIQIEAIVTVTGVLIFFGSYFLLYKKDKDKGSLPDTSEAS